MMMKFFDPDHWFWRGFGRLADYFILTMLWLMCSVPLITAGAASAALYGTASRCFRHQEQKMVQCFFRIFKKTLLRGVLMTVCWAAVGYLLAVGYNVIRQLGGGTPVWTVFGILYCVTLVLPLGILCWAVATESRLHRSFLRLHKNALSLAIAHPLRTLGAVAIGAAALYAGLYFPYLILFLPAAASHLQSLLLEPVLEELENAEGTTEIA